MTARALVVLLAACSGGAAKPDAMPDAYDWGNVAVIGRLCTLIDFRFPYGCPAGQDVAGLRVEDVASGASVMSVADGSFGLDVTGPGPVVLRVSGDGRRDSLVRVPLVAGRARDVIVPTATTVLWQQMLTAIGGTDDPTRSAIIIDVTQGTAPAQGIHVVTAVDTTGPVFYDAGGPFTWSQTAGTTDHGIAIVLGVAASSPQSLQLRDVVHNTLTPVDGLPVAAGALTFHLVDLAQTPP